MTILSRSLFAASVSALLAGTALVPGSALSQAPAQATAPEPGKAIALTQGQIDGLLVAQPELAALPAPRPTSPIRRPRRRLKPRPRRS